MINWMKYKNVYFLVSILLISVSVYSIINWKLNLGVDFKGGAIMIAYSIIALIILLYFSRAAKIRKRKAALLPNSKKQ